MRKIFLRTLLVASLIVLSIGLYGYFVEPKLLTTEYSPPLPSESLPTSFQYTKIGILADPDVGNNYSLSDLKKAVAQLNTDQPDLLIFTGDLISSGSLASVESSEIVNILKETKAPLGKYAVLGKNDLQDAGKVQTILESSGFQVLNNTNKKIYNQTDEAINLVGFSADAQPSTIVDTINNLGTDTPVMVIAQNPNVFTTTSKIDTVKLQISGYNHGGQIGIPFLNQIFIPSDSNKSYVKGMFEENNHYLYVSGGLGNVQGFPIRIFNWPSVDIIQL